MSATASGSSWLGGGEHGADLIGERDGDDSLLQGHADAWCRHEHEPAEKLAPAHDRQLGALGGQLESRSPQAGLAPL